MTLAAAVGIDVDRIVDHCCRADRVLKIWKCEVSVMNTQMMKRDSDLATLNAYNSHAYNLTLSLKNSLQ